MVKRLLTASALLFVAACALSKDDSALLAQNATPLSKDIRFAGFTVADGNYAFRIGWFNADESEFRFRRDSDGRWIGDEESPGRPGFGAFPECLNPDCDDVRLTLAPAGMTSGVRDACAASGEPECENVVAIRLRKVSSLNCAVGEFAENLAETWSGSVTDASVAENLRNGRRGLFARTARFEIRSGVAGYSSEIELTEIFDRPGGTPPYETRHRLIVGQAAPFVTDASGTDFSQESPRFDAVHPVQISFRCGPGR